MLKENDNDPTIVRRGQTSCACNLDIGLAPPPIARKGATTYQQIWHYIRQDLSKTTELKRCLNKRARDNNIERTDHCHSYGYDDERAEARDRQTQRAKKKALWTLFRSVAENGADAEHGLCDDPLAFIASGYAL